MSSVLPQWILRIIWTQWFHMQAEHYPNTSAQWLYHHRDFSKHDILFEFRDCFGKVELVRCNAQEFLTSPWAATGPQGGTMACFVQSATETNIDLLDEPWILGLVSLIVTRDLTYADTAPPSRTSSGRRC